MFSTFLSQRAAISLSGEESIEFLQGLISNDARLLANGNSIYAALLSPQGKFLHDFFLIPWQGKIFIDVRADRAKNLLDRLKIYRLRSKVEIAIDESVCIAVLWGRESEVFEQSDYKIYNDPRLLELGMRVIGTKDSISNFLQQNSIDLVEEERYEHFRLSLGVPDTNDMMVEKSLLLECGFEQLHGVDFSKGCYVGQEVTARSKFRGQVRKSFYSVRAGVPLPAAGTKIIVADKVIGEMRTSLDNIGIALVYNEEYEVAQSNNTPFLCDGVKVEIMPTEWINLFK